MSPRRWLFTILYLFCWPVLIMGLAGDRHWIPGWLLSGWIVAVGVSTVAWLAWRDPDLLAERYRMPGTGGQSRRDRRIVYTMAVGFLLWIALMPLDGRRFRWTPPMPRAVALIGGACLVLGWLFVFRALADNTFGSALVRVQRERGHRVITTGVYGWVRHPMYLGAAFLLVGGPLLTGAASALVVGLLLIALLALRSLDEEALLTRELPGYEEYRRRVRYRLIPLVW
jgi:protein-S-isoprenylcysteine O-methyltransferase Ste14